MAYKADHPWGLTDHTVILTRMFSVASIVMPPFLKYWVIIIIVIIIIIIIIITSISC